MTKVCPGCSGDRVVRVYNGTDSFGNEVSGNDTCPDCKGTGRIKMTWLESLQAKAAQK